jgi:hypothetical protein
MTEQHKHITLTVGFDVEQTTDTLQYRFTSPDNAQPNPITGLYASEIYFGEGDIVHLEILGGGAEGRFKGFKIIDCCLITRPLVTQAGPQIVTRHAPPSLFMQAIGATYNFPLDFSSDMQVYEDGAKKYRVVTHRWKRTLDVAQSAGRWKLSLVVTVVIEGGPDGQQQVRVFSFDPEGQVGPGTGVDDPRG